jgi:hypothetical protein
MWPERANRQPELANRGHRADIITSFRPSSTASRAGWGHRGAGTVGRDRFAGRESRADRTAVILTPDQQVRVFVSSTLGEPAAQRNPCATNRAACRSRRGWHNLVGNTQAWDLGQPVRGSARPTSCRRTAPAGHTSRSAAAKPHQGRARRPSQPPHPSAAGTRAGRSPCTCPALFQSVAAPN